MTLVDGLGLAGGGERLAREITVRLDLERFDPTLCVSRWSAQKAADPVAKRTLESLTQAGVGFLGLDRRSATDLGAWRPLLTLLRHGHVDILHAHKFGSNIWAALLSSLASTPVVVAHEHTWSFEGQPLRRFLDRNLIARRADAFVAVSTEDRRRMITVERIDPQKVIFVPNGIPHFPPPTGKDVRSELSLDPAAPVVGTVCGLRPQKALDVLIRAAHILAGRFPGIRVLIVGDGPERPRLEALASELGVGETVKLLGYRPDVPDLLRALDVAVCSSDFEGTPLSILEYMDAGLPVVSTRVGGVPDIVEDGVSGLLVEPRKPDALARALEQVLRDPRRAAEMGQQGRERRRAEFDIRVTVARIEQLYERLWEASGTEPPSI